MSPITVLPNGASRYPDMRWMPSRRTGIERGKSRAAWGAVLPVAIVVVYAGVLFAAWAVRPQLLPVGLIAVPMAVVIVLAGMRHPTVACMFLLFTTFLRLALPPVLPADPFIFAFIIVLATAGVRMLFLRSSVLGGFGAVETLMVAYVAWNVISMIAPHQYPPGSLLDPAAQMSVPRFILSGTVMPCAMFIVGRHIIDRPRQVRVLLWTVLAAAGYSSVVSILQFHGPASLVWPRYIVTMPAWPDRAVGVFEQPVVNGLVMIFGFILAMVFAHDGHEPRWRRALAMSIGAACLYGIYLTHTRAVWLAFVLVLILGALIAGRIRAGFLAVLTAVIAVVAAHWTAFTSADREAGGVGSPNEVEDRLNTIATSLWAIEHKPWFGWGIGRFTGVNTYHHQQFDPSVPWARGYGISSHLNDLGIFAELGVVGVTLWLAVLATIAALLVRSWRRLRGPGLCGRPLAVAALLILCVQTTAGLTVDLRYFNFSGVVVMLVAGMAVGMADSREGARRSRRRMARDRGTVDARTQCASAEGK